MLMVLLRVVSGNMLLVAGAWLCVAVGAPQDGDDVRPGEVADLMTMQVDANCGQVVVTCLIAGNPARMMLDTGATHSVISRDFALRAVPAGSRHVAAEGQVQGNAVEVPGLVVADVVAGGKTFRSWVILEMDLGGVQRMMKQPVDGILGMDVLRHLSFVFDFEMGRFMWGRFRELGGLARLAGRRDESGRLFVSAEVGGKPVSLLLDTGSSITLVAPRCWQAEHGQGGAAASVADVNGQREIPVKRGVPMSIRLAPGVSTEPVSPVLAPEAEGDGLLGVDILRRHVLMHVAEDRREGGFYIGPKQGL